LGRRRRKVVKIPRRKLPKIYLCPRCGEESIKVIIDREGSKASVICGNEKCKLAGEVPISSSEQAVDAYCRFSDEYYSGNPQ